MNGTNSRAFAIVGDLQNVGTQFQFNNGPLFSLPVEDWWNFIDEPTTITSGQTTAPFSVISSGDCFNFQLMGVYYQTNCLGCIPVAADSITCTSTPSTCTAANGTATATMSGTNGPYTYSWNPSGQNTQTATNLPPGLYTVTIVDGTGCSSLDTISVMGTGSLGLSSSQTNVQCNGASTGVAIIVPNGGSGPFTYLWSPNASTIDTASNLTAGTYTVNVSDNFGCANSFTFTITQPALVPIVGSVTGLSPVCLGYPSTLTASATGGAPPYTYSWISPASILNSVTVTPLVTTTYSVVIGDACFTPHDTVTFTVMVNPPPVISLAGDDTAACAPHCVNFTAQSNPALVSTLWNFGDSVVGTGSPVSHCYYNSGLYSVTLYVVDVNGCKDSITASNYITVYPNPVAGFDFISANPSTVLESNILIDDLSTGGDTCYWDFGDGNFLTVVGCGDVSNNYADTGMYHVQQIVVNNGGCKDTIEYDVYIAPYTTLYIPNAFTPNGNGSNDIFFIYGEFVDQYHLMVFDRWGNLIYESYDQQKGWDGKANGGKYVAQTDTYVYVLTYSEHSNKRLHKIIGHVNLIR
ncbi:MAG: PKD domain-containing protein [Bacteroidia bacterium]